jgi:hypothetical protein
MGRRRGLTAIAPGCHTDSRDLVAYQSPTGQLQEMEALAVVEAWLEMESVRSVAWWRCMALTVLGVGPMD